MGLTIHYGGFLRDEALLNRLIEEGTDVAAAHNWKYVVFEKAFPADSFGKETYDEFLYGLILSPPDCEPVNLCFLSNGRMSGPANFSIYAKSVDEQEKKYLYMLSTKTQYAGAKTHSVIIQLLKYISDKYLRDFWLLDEGQYWETGNFALLEENFNKNTAILDAVSDGLKRNSVEEREDVEAYLMRVIRKAHDKHNRPK